MVIYTGTASTLLTVGLVGDYADSNCLPGYQRIYRPYSGWVLSTMSRKSGILERVDSTFFLHTDCSCSGLVRSRRMRDIETSRLAIRGWPVHDVTVLKGKE